MISSITVVFYEHHDLVNNDMMIISKGMQLSIGHGFFSMRAFIFSF